MALVVVTEADEKRYAELQLMALDFARRGDAAALLPMIEAGLPVNLEDAKGNTLLMLASYHGHFELTGTLLDWGADVDRRNQRGQTPLGGSAFKGDTKIVARLLDGGADIDADNGHGMTPLMFASMFGRTDVVELLRKRGANSGTKNRYGISAGGLRWASPIVTNLMKFARKR